MLQFVMDMDSKTKDTESFLQALVGACKKRGIQYDVVTKLKDFDFELPYVILEPCKMVGGWETLDPTLDMDQNATARVIKDFVVNYAPESGCEVLLIGRGAIVGAPTTNLLMDYTNCQISVVNSWIGLRSLTSKMMDADIIINSSTSRIMADIDLTDKFIIDVNNNLHFKNVTDKFVFRVDQRIIGKETVKKILDKYGSYMEDQSEEACTILEKSSDAMF